MSKDIYDNRKVLPLPSKRFNSLLNGRIYKKQIGFTFNIILQKVEKY
jgi:hypothetical protein